MMTNYRPASIAVAIPSRPRHLDKIKDEDGVLDMFLSAKNGTRIHVKCDSYLLYMKRDEGDALRTINLIRENASLEPLIFLVDKSRLVRWFVSECEGMRKEEDLKHFVVASSNDVIDIICVDELTVEIS